jgi:hypothetical protein
MTTHNISLRVKKIKAKRILEIQKEASKFASNTPFKIWGEEVPCTYFLGKEGLSEEKKKELWVKVISDDLGVQKWIDREISYSKTVPYEIYMALINDIELLIN